MGQSGGPPSMEGFRDNQAQPRNSPSHLLAVARTIAPAQGSTQAHLGSNNRLRPSSFVPWPLDVSRTRQAFPTGSVQPNDILAAPPAKAGAGGSTQNPPVGPVCVCSSCQYGRLLPRLPVAPAWNGAFPAHFQPNGNILGPLPPPSTTGSVSLSLERPTGRWEPLPLERSTVRLETQQPWPEAPEYGSSGMVRSATASRAADQRGLGPDGSTDGPVSEGLELLADTAVAQPRAEPTRVALGTGTRTGQRVAGCGRGRAARNRRTEAARNVARTRRLERLARARLNQARARADILQVTRGNPGGRNDQEPSGPGF